MTQAIATQRSSEQADAIRPFPKVNFPEAELLPLSEFDDELCVRTAMAIYHDPALQKYSLDPQAPIRIVVENGNVKLYGVVDSAMDKQIAETRARGNRGVLGRESPADSSQSMNRDSCT